MESRLGPSGHFIGDTLSAADIMLSFPAEIAVMQGMAPRYPKLADFVNMCHSRPAWQRARDKGGAYYGYRSEEHTSELQSLMRISYAVFCLTKKNNRHTHATI